MSRVTGKVTKKSPSDRTGRGRSDRLARAAGGIFRLRGDLLAAGILATLRRWNAHGYRLGRELVKAGLPLLDSATLYRTLRDLERAGLVSSFWDTSSSGPARRMYSLTKAGDIFLGNWVETLQRFQAVFQSASEDIEASPDAAAGTGPSGDGRSPARRRASTGTTRRGTKGTGKSVRTARRRAGAARPGG